MECLYRYEDVAYSLGTDDFGDPIPGCNLKLVLEEYPILKRTPKGVWISLVAEPFFVGEIDMELHGKYRRFVLLSTKKRFACPTKEEALESFVARKKRYIQLLKARLSRAEYALDLAEDEG